MTGMKLIRKYRELLPEAMRAAFVSDVVDLVNHGVHEAFHAGLHEATIRQDESYTEEDRQIAEGLEDMEG